jgi:DNA-binding transcriptional LysR family regulator
MGDAFMNLDHLKYFLVLSKYEHYRQATEELCISQPGLSHAIASLEKEIGLPLFQKKGRNIVLTRYGKMLQNDAEKIIALVERSEASFANILDGGGILHLAGITRLASHLLPHLVMDFKKSSDSDGDFQFFTGLTPSIIQGVRDGHYDVGFCFQGDWKNDIEAVPFLKQKMMVIVNPSHPLASKSEVTLNETLAYPQIVFSHTSVLRNSIDELFSKIHAYPEIVYEVEQDIMIAEMVACDFGIAVMPDFPNVERRGVLAIPIKEPFWENTFFMIRRKNDFHSPLEEEFFQYCLNRCQI